jgi:hypothetical protein
MKHIQIFKAIVLGTVISLVSFVSNAGETPKNTSVLSYVGLVENKPVFRLTINDNSEGLLIITVSNKIQGTLYTQKVKAGNRSMLFQLDGWDLDADVLQVEVKNVITKKSELFSINMESRTVLETSISKH